MKSPRHSRRLVAVLVAFLLGAPLSRESFAFAFEVFSVAGKGLATFWKGMFAGS